MYRSDCVVVQIPNSARRDPSFAWLAWLRSRIEIKVRSAMHLCTQLSFCLAVEVETALRTVHASSETLPR